MTIDDVKKIYLPANILLSKNNRPLDTWTNTPPNGAISLYEVIIFILSVTGSLPASSATYPDDATAGAAGVPINSPYWLSDNSPYASEGLLKIRKI